MENQPERKVVLMRQVEGIAVWYEDGDLDSAEYGIDLSGWKLLAPGELERPVRTWTDLASAIMPDGCEGKHVRIRVEVLE